MYLKIEEKNCLFDFRFDFNVLRTPIQTTQTEFMIESKKFSIKIILILNYWIPDVAVIKNKTLIEVIFF